jgi:glycerophosphoryl diester phosphodiesterase
MSNLQSLPLAYFYQGRILNFAHRGARLQAPENTLPAFELAADLGADGVELDVQLSLDDVPVVIHDYTVDRTTGGSGPVGEKTLEELRELDAGAFFSDEFAGALIPTLDEVFEAVGSRLLINVELKVSGTSARLSQVVVDTIEAHDLASRVLISSFNPVALRHVRRVSPQTPVGYIYAPDRPAFVPSRWLARSVIGPHQARHPHFSMVDKRYLAWTRGRGYRVNVWTVNQVADIRRMRNLGVDMITSDAPDLVQDVLQGEL